MTFCCNSYTSLAHTALAALLQRRSKHGLLGGHIDITNGQWSHRTSSLGSGSDSLCAPHALPRCIFVTFYTPSPAAFL